MNYRVVESTILLELERMVNEQIKLGWKPIGGISTTLNEDGCTTYYQAIVK